MDNRLIVHCVSLLIFLHSIESHGTNGSDSLSDDALRVPRVSGRIVKIYSGSRPDPIHCTGEGFQGDPLNCAVFYRCMKSGNGKFTVFRFQCGPGTVYDPDTEVCNHPQSTRRKECGGLIESSIDQTDLNEIDNAQPEIPSPIVTKQPVYTESTITSKPVISTLLTTQDSNVSTVSPWRTSSERSTKEYFTITTRPSTEKTSTVDQSYDNNSNKRTKYPKHSQPTSESTKISSVTRLPNDDICISDGFMGDSKDCRKFYRCVSDQRGGYIKYEFSCSESTMWDDDIQSCNHPWAVKRSRCGKSSNNNDYVVSSISKSNRKTTTQQQSKTTSHPNQTKKEKSQNNEINSSSQHQTQTNYGLKVQQFQTQISNGSVTQNQTQQNYGNHVSETIPYESYGEKGVQTQLQTNHLNQSSEMQVQINEMSIKMSSTVKYYDHEKENYTTHVNKNDKNNNKCTQSGFMGDDNDCKKFYRCVDNGKGSYMRYEFSCGEGTVWDAKIEACNHAWAVKECGGKVSTEIEGQTTEPSTTTLSQTYYTTPTKSTPNYITPSSTFVVDIDDDSGYGNHIQQHTTTYSTVIKETTAKPSKEEDNDCKSSGFIGAVNNCKTFFRCVDNGRGSFTKYEFQCGEGTVWDPDIEACNHAWAVKNCGGIGASNDKVDMTTNSGAIDLTSQVINTVSTQTTTQKNHENDEYDTGYNESNNSEIPQITSSTKKPQNQDITDNSCKSSGFMGDKNDCSKFYRCVDKGNGTYVRFEFTCGEGTVWDPKIEACNHPWAVEKCGGSGSGAAFNETSSESSSTISYEEIESGYPTQSDKNTEIPTKSTSTIKSTTSVIIIENNNCEKSGFMADYNDCKKFYRCVDKGDGSYIRYEFSCGEGTVWDPKIEACNHAWAVEKCGSVSSTTNVNLITSSENPIWSDEEINNGYPSHHQNDEELDKTTSKPIFESTTVLGNSVCKSSGFIGDKHDCKKFYRCVDDGKGEFIKYEFSCGEGTVWDQSIESCNHVGSVKDCGISMNQSKPIYSESTTQSLQTTISETGGNGYYTQITEGSVSSIIEEPQDSVTSNVCTKEGFFGDKNDCKKFYRCVDNSSGGFNKYEFVCGEGTVWVQDIQACDHATLDQPCGSSTLEISKEPSHENDEIYTESSIKTSTTSSTQISVSTQASENPQSSSFACKSEGFFGDSDDCMKFYRCVDNGKQSFTKYDFICGEGTFWDQDIQACNHKTENKNCTKTQTSSTTLATESNIGYSTTTLRIEQQSSTEKSQTSNSSKNDKCISEGFYSNSNDCSKFYRCVSDGKGGYIKYDFSCGEGTVWVQDIQACDYDDNAVTCNKQNGSTNPQTTYEYQSSTQALDLLTSTSSESQAPEKQNDEYPENEPISDGQCMSEGFHANDNDCKKFFRCIDDGHGGFTKYDFVCGEGTAWDENIQSCNHISEVKRCQVSIQEESHTQSVMQDEEISQTEGTSTTTKTPSENTESTTTVSNNKCEKEGYFGNTEDCKQFYRCVDNGNGGLTKYEFTCGDGTIWDQDITTCNHPEDVTNPSCEQKQPSTTSAPSSSTTSQSSTSAIESSNQNSNCSQEQSSKKPVHKNITCDKAGYYGDPNDCKKFYRCVDWDGDGQRFSVYHFDCGEGTIWDPALDTCNHEESVYPPRDCSGTQSQNEVITEDTTTTSQEEATTEKSTTIEQSTTQQTGTSDYTTTQQSTTSEQTTMQQTATSEQTTTQKTTDSVQTTTQQSTTSEQTTTQQATTTTSEQTATQTSTSTEQTTSQQPTATEQTTMQQTTSSEPTSTRQSTTTQQTVSSEPTTTQQPTTSEKTTTQQSTSSDSTTTQQSTSSEQATTQQSTSTEQTSTQQFTTTQETTTAEQSTATTTQQSTNNEQTTTEKTTTSESTTQQSTTSENSKEELTPTEQNTTEQTLDGTTTEQQSSDASTTEQYSSTTEQSNQGTTTTEGKQESSTEENSSNKECPDTEENQYLYVCPTSFRRHPKYCNLFYQCTEDDNNHDNKIAVFTCPNNTIYDESKTQCVEEEKADKKCDGEIAQRRRFKRLDTNHKEPIVVGEEKQSCPTVGNLPFEKRVECSPAFLKCMKSKSGVLHGFVYKCPEGYMYWSISRRCELIGNISDCKRSNNNWDKRWEIPVEKTNIDAFKYKLIRPSFN